MQKLLNLEETAGLLGVPVKTLDHSAAPRNRPSDDQGRPAPAC